MQLKSLLCVLLVCVLATACQPKPQNPFSPEFLSTLTARPQVTRTPIHTAVITPTPPEFIQVTPTESLGQPTPVVIGNSSGPVNGRIVFACYIDGNDDICIMNADGSNYQRLTDHPATDFYPSLSPDGLSVLFSSRRDDRFEIYRMSTDGSDQTRLTTNVGGAYAPSANLQGDVIFANDIGPYQALWVVPLNGGKAQSYLDMKTDTIDPAWSVDGSILTFASLADGERQVFYTSTSDLDPQMVTNLPNMGGRNSLSPDGNTLVFYAGSGYDRNIFTININGSGLRQLTTGGDNLGPCWSPDGEWITFASWRDGNGEIYIMRADGSDLRRLTYNNYSDWQPRWGP